MKQTSDIPTLCWDAGSFDIGLLYFNAISLIIGQQECAPVI
jgi:hypothetical protein